MTRIVSKIDLHTNIWLWKESRFGEPQCTSCISWYPPWDVGVCPLLSFSSLAGGDTFHTALESHVLLSSAFLPFWFL